MTIIDKNVLEQKSHFSRVGCDLTMTRIQPLRETMFGKSATQLQVQEHCL